MCRDWLLVCAYSQDLNQEGCESSQDSPGQPGNLMSSMPGPLKMHERIHQLSLVLPSVEINQIIKRVVRVMQVREAVVATGDQQVRPWKSRTQMPT